MSNVQIIVLAAGQGKRMGTPALPKVLTPLKGKPLIEHLLAAVKQSGVDPKPVIVIGQHAEKVRTALGEGYTYVTQAEQLGTGHAVGCARDAVASNTKDIMVLYGDHPYVSAETIAQIIATHQREKAVLTMATVQVADFNDWRDGFKHFGRILRDASGTIQAIVEVKDATIEQQEIKELNSAYYCFQVDWLWPRLAQLRNQNSQSEYYLTDLVGMATSEGKKITTVSIAPKEALGVNSKAELETLSKL